MSACQASAGGDPTTKFRPGVDVFVQLALDELFPRHKTERIAMLISRGLPPVLRPKATDEAISALFMLELHDAEAYMRDEIPFILGWKTRQPLFGPGGDWP